MRRRHVLLALCAAATAASARAQPSEAERLFAALAADGERVAAFVERRYSPLLRKPLEVRGRLRFVPPAMLEREVEAPRRERVRIDGDWVSVYSVGDDGRESEYRLSLAAQPQLASLADALRAILAGDHAALVRRFEVRVLAPLPRWRAELAPRDDPLSVTVIRLAGAGRELRRVEIAEASGDRTEIELTTLQ